MRNRRFFQLAGICMICLSILALPTVGDAKSVKKPGFKVGGYFHFQNSDDKKIACSWTCLNGNTGSATTETSSQCYAACAGACGSACGPA